MKLVTSSQMRELDRRATDEYGIPSLLLMENAGLKTFASIAALLDGVEGKSILVISGKGNNGGDGFVIARHLRNAGALVSVALIADAAEIKGDARINLEIVFRMGIPCLEVVDASEMADVQEAVASCDLVVDALFGTGVKGDITGPAASVIEAVNTSGKMVVSVDIPSGVNADTGEAGTHCIYADETVTFALPKIGTISYPGAGHVGRLTVADIGIPQELLEDVSLKVELITQELVRQLLPSREPDAHKGTFGHLAVFAGSDGLTGAAAMASESAARIGAGLVTLGCPWSLRDIMEVKLTEVMTVPLSETPVRSLSPDAVNGALSLMERCNAAAIGPGVGRHPDTVRSIHKLLAQLQAPIVVDADGLNALADDTKVFGQISAPIIITPHPGEMARLMGTSSTAIQSDRLRAATDAAARFNSVVVLKGARTIVAAPDGSAFINPTGNVGMATGGMGDVLTGAIGGLLAQGLPALDAAICGVYIHGLAGDIAAEDLAPVGLLASDLIIRLPKALASVVEGVE